MLYLSFLYPRRISFYISLAFFLSWRETRANQREAWTSTVCTCGKGFSLLPFYYSVLACLLFFCLMMLHQSRQHGLKSQKKRLLQKLHLPEARPPTSRPPKKAPSALGCGSTITKSSWIRWSYFSFLKRFPAYRSSIIRKSRSWWPEPRRWLQTVSVSSTGRRTI